MELANPIAPWPGNLASSGGGRAGQGEPGVGALTTGTEREEEGIGNIYALLRVICPLTSLGAGQVMKHCSANTYDYCHRCLLA